MLLKACLEINEITSWSNIDALFSLMLRIWILVILIMISLGYIFHFIVFKEEINVSSRAASHPSGFSSYLHAKQMRQTKSHVSIFYSHLPFFWNTLNWKCCIMPPNRSFLCNGMIMVISLPTIIWFDNEKFYVGDTDFIKEEIRP